MAKRTALFEALHAAETDYRFVKAHRRTGLGSTYTETDEAARLSDRDQARQALLNAVLTEAAEAIDAQAHEYRDDDAGPHYAHAATIIRTNVID